MQNMSKRVVVHHLYPLLALCVLSLIGASPTVTVMDNSRSVNTGSQKSFPPGKNMSSTPPTIHPLTSMLPPDTPALEFCFEIKLTFSRIDMLRDLPSGIGRGAVYVDGGTVRGPRLNGRVIEHSGGDWATFRSDDVLETDARYMLEADDGTHILMRNRGFLWGRTPDVLGRIQAWMFQDGDPVDASEFYLRASPSFEVERGPHDWLTKHIFVGIGTRQRNGNTIRYYAVM